MIHLEWLFLMQLVMGVLMIVFLQKLTQMKKQIDEITKGVVDYLSFITEDMAEEEKNVVSEPQKAPKKDAEEAANRLIQAVLEEYFP